MTKLIFATVAVTLLSGGPVLAESVLGDPAGTVTRQEWGTSSPTGYASNPGSPEPLAQVPFAPRGDNSVSLSQEPSAKDHAQGASPGWGCSPIARQGAAGRTRCNPQ